MLVTTSKHASLELKKSALAFSIEKKSKYLNRGKKTIEEIVSIARNSGHDKIAIIKEKGKIDYMHISSRTWKWV